MDKYLIIWNILLLLYFKNASSNNIYFYFLKILGQKQFVKENII